MDNTDIEEVGLVEEEDGGKIMLIRWRLSTDTFILFPQAHCQRSTTPARPDHN